jgi:hypothetical protein
MVEIGARPCEQQIGFKKMFYVTLKILLGKTWVLSRQKKRTTAFEAQNLAELWGYLYPYRKGNKVEIDYR